MGKVTLNVLAEKIDSLHNDIKEMKGDVRENTQFRLQAKGALTAVIMIATVLGAGLSWVLNKFMR